MDVFTWWSSDIESRTCCRKYIQIGSHNTSAYVLLANICAVAGRWDEVKTVRMQMESIGIKNPPGQTWIKINKKIHSFLADDKSHEFSNEIQEELKAVYDE
jgi:hypothetical protein